MIDKEESPVGQLLPALAVPTSSFSPPHLLPLLVRGSGSVPDLHVLGLSFDTPHPTPANEKDERGAARETQETPHPTPPPTHPPTSPLLSLALKQRALADFLLRLVKFDCKKLDARLLLF